MLAYNKDVLHKPYCNNYSLAAYVYINVYIYVSVYMYACM